MANEFRVKNGLIIDEVSSNAGNVTIADGDISTDGTMTITSTNNAANALYLRANAGTSETIKIHADQGSGADSITILSDAGGIDVDAAGAVSVESSAGSITIGSTIADGEGLILGKSGAAEIQLKPHGTAANEVITITNTAGTANDAVKVAAAAGGITLDAELDIALDANGGDVFVKDNGTVYGSLTNSSGRLHIYSGTTAALKFGSNSAAANASFMGDLTVNGTTQTGSAANLFQVSAGNSLDDTVEARLYNSTESPTTISNVGNVLVLDNGNNAFEGAQGVVMTIGSSANTSNNTETWWMGTAANLTDSWGIGYTDAKHWDTTSFAGSASCVTDCEQWLLRVTTGGKMTIGKPAGQSNVDTGPMNKLQVNHTSADGDDGILILRANTTTADGALLGSIGFDSTDGNVPSTNTEAAAYIAAYATEDHGGGDKGGELVFGLSRVDDNDDTTSFPIVKVTSDSSSTGWVQIENGAASGGELRFMEDSDNGTHYAGFKAPASVTSNSVYTLPAAFPGSNKVLQSTSSGVLSWEAAASGGASSFDDLSDVTYSGGDLTISSLDTIISGAIVHDSSGKITLDSDTGDIAFSDGGTEQLTIDMDGTAGEIIIQLKVDSDDLVFKQYDGTEVLRLDDDGSVYVKDNLSLNTDSSVLKMGAGNDFTITHDGTTGATIAGNPLTLDSGGDITLDADGADVVLKDGGTQYGALTNSSGNLIIKSGSTTMLTGSGANATIAGNMTVTGNLTINGTTTEVSSTSITVEDALLELGMVDGSAPSSTTSIDLGILVNYYASSAKKGAFFWDSSATCWALTEVATESGQVLTPAAGATEMRFYYDEDNYYSVAVAANGATTLSTVDSDGTSGNLQITADGTAELEGTTITLDSAGDIKLNAGGNDISLKAGSTSFGSFTNNSGVLQIKSATDKELEIRSERDMTFVIDDDASDSNSFFTFKAEDNTLADSSNFDGRVGPVTTKYYSTSLLIGQTEFGKGVLSSNSAGTLFTYDGTVFGAVEVTIHITDGTTDQINKMMICADTSSGDAVNYSNYSVLYSDGSTELGTCAASISSDTVSVTVDADNDDVVTYAVTFLA